MKKYISLEEAATAIGKSKRTIQRYVSKLSASDKKKHTSTTDGTTRVAMDWVNNLSNVVKKQPEPQKQANDTTTTDGTTHATSDTTNVIEELKAEVKDLKQTVKNKDKQLVAKDALIEQNINDFKLLTSKVLYLSEANQKLLETPTPKEKPAQEQEVKSELSIEMLSIGIGIAIALLSFIVVYEIFIK
jgi:hypothetical protein